MKLDDFKQKGELVKENEKYKIYDYKLERLIVSLTELKPQQETRGHDHKGVEEVYYFIKGKGKMKVGEEVFDVEEGDIVPIQDGIFHRVINPNNEVLQFFAIFEKYERK